MSVDYALTPSDDGKYIEVVAIGEATRADVVDVTAAQFSLGKKLGISCFLVDATKAPNIGSVSDNVWFTVTDVPAIPAPDPKVYTAVIIDPADHSHDFYAAFAQSRGLHIQLFWDRNEAIAYLEEAAERLDTEKPPPPQSTGRDA